MQAIRRRMGRPDGLDKKKGAITGAQWAVLHLLLHRESIAVKDAAESLGITSSAATQLIDALVKQGLVTREEGKEDRRLVELRLSKKAALHVAQMREVYLERLSEVFEALSDQELAQYVSLSKKLAALAKQKTL